MSNSNGNRKSPGIPTNNSAANKKSSGGPNGTGQAVGMQITSDEINFLVFRYLQEAGFVHSAFTFAYESMIGRKNLSRSNVPPGALISFLQKGLQYVGIEETMRQDGSQRQREKGSGKKGANGAGGDPVCLDFSLLSPQAIKGLTRRDPPIKLNVPPASAAAAVKAKLEFEAQQAKEAAALPKPNQNGHLVMNQMNTTQPSIPIQQQNQPQQRPLTSNQLQRPLNENHGFGNGYLPQKEQVAFGRPSEISNQMDESALSARVAAATVLASGLTQTAPMSIQNDVNMSSFPQPQNHVSSSAAAAMDLMDKAAAQIEQREKNAAAARMEIKEQNNKPAAAVVESVANNQRQLGSAEIPPSNVQSSNVQNQKNGTAVVQQANQTHIGSAQVPPQGTMQQEAIHQIEMEDKLTRAPMNEVLELNQHTSEVFMCAWNPVFTNILATGSGDASARIWTMGGQTSQAGTGPCRLLQHGSDSDDNRNKDVTTLEWSSSGELLATGSYDGVARVWTKDGALMNTLQAHQGPIFSLKWNKRGNFLLSGSYDKSTIVWDVSPGNSAVRQQFNHHQAPALDVDWKDDDTFASCSTDKTVLICRVGSNAPLHIFTGHTDEVNAVKWDPSGTLLASCSDDYTAKVWDISRNSDKPLHDFKNHKQEIYTVKWSPTGEGSANPNKPLMLATASFDATVRLWNVRDGSCISILSRHRDSVYSVSFSPSGDYLASGSLAGQLYIWRIKDGKPVRNFKGSGDIFEVAWNKEETRVAACFSSNVVNVIDFKA